MTTELSQWIAALPEDILARSERDDMRELLDELAHRPVTVGRVARLWKLGSLQATLFAGFCAHRLRSGFASASVRERSRNETQLAAALATYRTMGYLRGAAMKVGQLLASYPELVPEQVVDTLSSLHFQAPPMHFALLREMFVRELGASPEELFAEFETEAFAAASLGQVHRARLHTGERVAVKIQYPNIGRAIRDDFANLNVLLAAMRLSASWDNLRAQFDDVRRMVELETDYTLEAEHLRRARELFDHDDEIVVPRVHERFSSQRVLTMERVEGEHLERYLATRPSQADRDRRGAQMFRALFRMYYRGRTCYTDPHAGNYVFMPDGRLALLDFGSMRTFGDADWEYLLSMEHVHTRDRAQLRTLVERAADLREGEHGDDAWAEHMMAMTEWLWAPLRHAGPFDFGERAFLERGLQLYVRGLAKGYTRSRPVNTWLARCFFGVRALCWKLGAQFDVGALHRAETRHLGCYGGIAP